MILTNDEMRAIMELVLLSTRDKRLAWRHEHGKVSATMPNRTIAELVRDDHGKDFILTLNDDAGILLGQVKAPAEGSGPDESQLRDLYELAFRTAGRSVYYEIVDALTRPDLADVSVTTTTPPPRVTDQQGAMVLRKMAGEWDLNFTHGKERVSIREDGTYWTDKSAEPKFKLKVLAWNENKSTAEVAKDFFGTTRRLQIEFLVISADAMVGHAKHDLHKLSYKRVVKLL